jgi:hypothetical protein
MAGTTADRPDRSGPPERREPDAVRGAAGRRLNANPWNLLLLVPLVATLFPAFYNRTGPELAGWPFFYWYQMVAIPCSVLITLVVYRATRGER